MNKPRALRYRKLALAERAMQRRIYCDGSPMNASEAYFLPPSGFPRAALPEELNRHRSLRLTLSRDYALKCLAKPT
jgi:hypothetical protein